VADFLYGVLAGIALMVAVLGGFGLYVRTHQEQIMRTFIRKGIRAKVPHNSS
jgi:hypothetical protein